MSIVRFCKRQARRRILAGDVPFWISNNPRAVYIASVTVSCPDWVDRVDLEILRAWARCRTIMTGDLHVPVTHPRVSGLTVPWNLQVIHWRVNGSKGNYWCPEQDEMF